MNRWIPSATIAATITTELQERYDLDPADVDRFRRDGFVHLRGVLSRGTLDRYAVEIANKVIELNTMHLPMEERSTYHKAFLHVINLWRESEVARELVFARRLAAIATDLLGTAGVRLYHDQALYKEPSGGITPWHVDQHYWPLSGDKTCTVWIPLQDTPIEMGPLSFAAGSQRYQRLRDLPISDDSELLIQEAMDREQFPYVQEPFALGDVSFRDIEVAEPVNDSQRNDLEAWMPGARVGEVPTGPLNPILYEV